MRRTAAELDAMSPAAFEQMLYEDFAVDRTDLEQPTGPGTPVNLGALPVRAAAAVELLELSQSEFVRLLRAGWLRRPAKLTNGQVAWRHNEITAHIPPRPQT